MLSTSNSFRRGIPYPVFADMYIVLWGRGDVLLSCTFSGSRSDLFSMWIIVGFEDSSVVSSTRLLISSGSAGVISFVIEVASVMCSIIRAFDAMSYASCIPIRSILSVVWRKPAVSMKRKR